MTRLLTLFLYILSFNLLEINEINQGSYKNPGSLWIKYSCVIQIHLFHKLIQFSFNPFSTGTHLYLEFWV
ncbi:hypothetical protein E2C01_039620 [Portunus trituberculatus]|uniref:Uncharacterized protein n=1 Tax=Portunus trituberculatus TaxID=210409 RepID=A0A5B7FNH7_PORTR|nr:hypothetical protein [Portunus trituberculatus]